MHHGGLFPRALDGRSPGRTKPQTHQGLRRNTPETDQRLRLTMALDGPLPKPCPKTAPKTSPETAPKTSPKILPSKTVVTNFGQVLGAVLGEAIWATCFGFGRGFGRGFGLAICGLVFKVWVTVLETGLGLVLGSDLGHQAPGPAEGPNCQRPGPAATIARDEGGASTKRNLGTLSPGTLEPLAREPWNPYPETSNYAPKKAHQEGH